MPATSKHTSCADADELLPIQEDIQMADPCAARIKTAKVKPQSPVAMLKHHPEECFF